MSTVTQERMESAIAYLAETDTHYADAKADMERAEILRKRARSRIFLTESGTVAERQAKADIHPDVGHADDEYIEGVRVYETLRAKRERAGTVIEVWRSLYSGMKRGLA